MIFNYFFHFDQNLIELNQIDSHNFNRFNQNFDQISIPHQKFNFLHKMTSDDEEMAEKLPKTAQNSQQSAENISRDQNKLFETPLAIRRRRLQRSESNSSSQTRKKKAKAINAEQMEMGRATLIASLLLLAGICAVHLLLATDNQNGFVAKNNKGIVTHFGHPLPRSIDYQINPKMRKRADQFAQSQLEKLVRDLEQLHTNLDESSNRKISFRVNMLLTEHRRRNAVQRPRSVTPIPANLPMVPNRPRRAPRTPNSMSNSENWPPQQIITTMEASTSNQIGGMGEEPTLMDYDAIDAYWRWDIEQEKGPTHQYSYNNHFQFVEPQQNQQWTPNAQQNDESAEMFLYEHDIQLLTEKTQFPELSIFGQNTLNEDENLPTNGLEEDDYLLADISQTKWELPPQWPTTSSGEEQEFGAAEFGLENNGNRGDGHGILWTTQRLKKLLPFQSEIKEDEGIGITELLNIPLGSPPPASADYFEYPQQNVPPIGAEEEAPISSNSCSPSQFLFIPSPQTTSADQPILFDDISLAEATLINSTADGQIDTLSREFAHQLPLPLTETESSHPKYSEEQNEEEEGDEMLLSTLFPQLFHQPIQNSPNHTAGSPLQIQRSLSMSSDGTNANLEVILRELATADLLLNASNLASAATISPQLSPLQIPLNIQTPTFSQQQQAYSPPSFPSIPTMLHQNQQQSPLLGPNSLSPILEQFNQTQQLMNVPSSSSAAGFSSMFASPQDHAFYCISQSRISARCSSTTSSGFGSSGADTLASTSPSFAFGNGIGVVGVLHDDSSLQQNSPFSSVNFRYEDKLVPKAKKMANGKGNDVDPIENSEVNGGVERPKAKGKRGRRSKDDSLVNQHGLPYSAEHLAAMPYREYAALMADGRLSDEQKAMIKKIRRRGRNKLAARKCRERRLNPKEGEEEEEFDEENDDDQIIDVVGQTMAYEDDYKVVEEDESNISSSLDNFYEDEMKYEPAFPSTHLRRPHQIHSSSK